MKKKWLLLLMLAWLAVVPALADEKKAAKSSSATSPKWNVLMRTMGGKQFWTDHLIHGGWRIQQNVLTGHYRLLDPDNSRRTWGSWDECLERWKILKKELQVPPLKHKVVIVLHGLIRSRSSMYAMARYLEQDGEFSVLNFSYASTRAKVADHAKALADVVSHLEGVDEIDFVAHSLGNLVIRHLMGDQMAAESGRGVDPRIQRFVMLAPPNNGAELAERFRNNPVFGMVFGVSGLELAKRWEELQKHLAVPPCEFGIIAGGGKTDDSGMNPLLEGNDDFVVSVQETRLAGARDFMVINRLHSFIMDQPEVQKYTRTFLKQGYFVSADKRQPIPAEVSRNAKSP